MADRCIIQEKKSRFIKKKQNSQVAADSNTYTTVAAEGRLITKNRQSHLLHRLKKRWYTEKNPSRREIFTL